MTVNTLLIRADANTHIGTGHVMRCLALAQAWQDNGGAVTFLMMPCSPSLEQRIRTEGMNVLTLTDPPGSQEDAATTAEYAKINEASWVVVDGYQFGAEYQRLLKVHNCNVLFIDDYGHAEHYYADIVLNQNIYAEMSFYKNHEPYTRFLLGTKYVLLRREFLKWSGWHRDIPEVAQKILITLGGGDPDNITYKFVESLRTIDLDGLEVKVIIGVTNPHVNVIREMVKDHSHITLINNAENIPELMAWADLAISAGGSTCWELAFMGLSFILYPITKNQIVFSESIHVGGFGINLGFNNNLSNDEIGKKIEDLMKSSEKRTKMRDLGQKEIDGKGIIRVIQTMDVYSSSCTNK